MKLIFFIAGLTLSLPAFSTTKVSWFDIRVSSITEGKRFYGKLFDWTFYDMSQGDVVGVGILKCANPSEAQEACQHLGSMWQMNFRKSCAPETNPPNHCAVRGFKSGTIIYFKVDDTERVYSLARSLGAKDYLRPINVPTPEGVPPGTYGSAAIFTDPFGIQIGLSSDKPLNFQ